MTRQRKYTEKERREAVREWSDTPSPTRAITEQRLRKWAARCWVKSRSVTMRKSRNSPVSRHPYNSLGNHRLILRFLNRASRARPHPSPPRRASRHRPNRRCPRDLHASPPAGSSGPPLVSSLTARASDQEEP